MKHCERRVEPLDPLRSTSPDRLVRALRGCAFQGRKLAECTDIWEAMCRHPGCTKVLTLAGAMIPAGMGETVMRLIEGGAVDVIVSTGANVTHDFINGLVEQGHYQGSEWADDVELRRAHINRIFDVYLPDAHYFEAQDFLYGLLERSGIRGPVPTHRLTRLLGEAAPRRCLLKVAAEHDVPIFVPAMTDCEVGLQIARLRRDGFEIVFDEMADVEAFASIIEASEAAGCIIIGGGVPRNWTQEVFPYLEYVKRGKEDLSKYQGYRYGVRITTDRPEFGGLSGCTFDESKSWGKYAVDARYASVVCDATIALPLMAAALLERLGTSA